MPEGGAFSRRRLARLHSQLQPAEVVPTAAQPSAAAAAAYKASVVHGDLPAVRPEDIDRRALAHGCQPPPYHWLEPLRVPEEQRPPLFDEAKLAACFDREQFLRDGFVVFPGVMLPEVQKQCVPLLSSCLATHLTLIM